MPSSRLALIAPLLVTIGLLLPSAAAASPPIGTSEPFLASFGPGGISSADAVAVSDREAGDLYVLDGNQNQRVDQFKPDGEFVRAFGWGIVPGAVAGTATLTAGSSVITNVTTTLGAFATGTFGGAGKFITGPGIPTGTQIINVTSSLIELSNPATETRTSTVAVAAGPGNVPTDEVQRLTVAATTGQFELTFRSLNPGSTVETTAALEYDAGAAEVQAALEALPNVAAANVAVSGGPGGEKGEHPYLIDFKGRYADTNVHQLSVTGLDLSGGNPSTGASVTTPQQGAGVPETCTTVCLGASSEEGTAASGNGAGGSEPGQFDYSDEVAVDNSCAQQEPALTGSECDAFDPSYGDVYVVDQRNFRIEKYGPQGEFLLIFGGEVNKTKVHEREEEEANAEPITVTEAEEDVCAAADLLAGDTCGAGVPGTGPSHFYAENPPTGGGGSFASKTWFTEGNNSIAVGPGGTVYVGDYGRIQEFESDGTFAGEFELPVGAGEEPQFVGALALNSAGDIYERSATNYRDGSSPTQVPGVREFDPSHTTLLHTFDAEEPSAEPTNISLDRAGDLFVTDFGGREIPPSCSSNSLAGCPAERFLAFRPSGALYAELSSPQVQVTFSPPGPRAAEIAVDEAAGNLYVTSATGEGLRGAHVAAIPLPAPGPPRITEEHVTDLEPTTAVLHAVVNPDEFDTHYRFQLITEAAFKANEEAGHDGFTGAEQTALTDLDPVERPNPVQAAISPLIPATAYRWRVLAESECEPIEHPDHICVVGGQVQLLESLPAVSVRDFTTQTVGPELVTLKAELNPNGSATHYEIHYGTAAGSYSNGSAEGTLPVGNDFVKIKERGTEGVTFTGLEPHTTYHYQLVTENGYGEEKTADAAFTTEHSAAEERAAESCPNTNLREENNSLSLPDCRAYEKASLSHKEGGEAFKTFSLSPSGERVLYQSEGVFAGAVLKQLAIPYLAHRTPTGWVTQPVITRLAPPPVEPFVTGAGRFSPEMGRWLFAEGSGLNSERAAGNIASSYYSMGVADGADGAPVLHATPTVGPLEGELRAAFQFMEVNGMSSDLSRLFITTSSRLLPSPGDPRADAFGSAGPEADRIYEISGTGGSDPSLRLVAEVPHGLKGGGCNIDDPSSIGRKLGEHPRITNEDGTIAIYTSPVELYEDSECGPGKASPYGLFARAGEAAPVQLDVPPPAPQCTSGHPCATPVAASVLYDGASADGSRVWFTTTRPLIDSDSDSTSDLYLAKLEPDGQLGELVQASVGEANPSHPVPGKGAEVIGTVEVSQDGSHAAFVAHGVLTTQPSEFGETSARPAEPGESAAQGADNLYVSDESGEAKFVARLCSGPEESGSLKDPACPAELDNLESLGENDDELWLPGVHVFPPAHFTPNGGYLVFTSLGRLAPGDTDDVKDVYRYDFQTGQLIRISFGRDGNDANGNDVLPAEFAGRSGSLADANPLAEDAGRAVSADGSVVIFKTAAPLVSHDTNASAKPGCGELESNVYGTGCDIYEWEQQSQGTCAEPGGCISLVSPGLTPQGEESAIISSSGRDIAFQSTRNLIPEDTDGVGDVYDAHIDGGFHNLHAPPICGSPEACRPTAAAEPPPPTLATPNFVGPGNSATQLSCAKGRVRVKRHGQVRCIAKHHKKKQHRKKGRNKGKHRRSTANRGGGK